MSVGLHIKLNSELLRGKIIFMQIKHEINCFPPTGRVASNTPQYELLTTKLKEKFLFSYNRR